MSRLGLSRPVLPEPGLGSPNRLLSLPSHLGGPSPARTADDYQYEPDYEQRREGRVVEQTVDCQQRGSHDEEETGNGGELGERSHKDLQAYLIANS